MNGMFFVRELTAMTLAFVVGCTSGEAANSRSEDGSVEGSVGGRSAVGDGSGGSAGDAVVCGGETCELHNASGVQSNSCCTDEGACGVRVVFAPGCLPQKRPGGIYPKCAMFEVPAKLTMPGCCGPDGCGALATFDSLGCIPNEDLGRAKVSCSYSSNGVPADASVE